MKNVASVILNRAANPSWWGASIVSVCTAPYQFSCRNMNDPNRAKMLAVTMADPEFAVATRIADLAVSGALPDATGGADSYYALSMHNPPSWAATARRTYADGWHAFFITRNGLRQSVPNHSVIGAAK